MIETLPIERDDVVAVEAVGEVHADDYQQVLVPAVEAALETHDKIRLLYVLGDRFEGYSAGAAWEDTKLGFEHVRGWDRMAVVTDADWVRHGVNAFGWMLPGQVKVFAMAERAEAEAWIVD